MNFQTTIHKFLVIFVGIIISSGSPVYAKDNSQLKVYLWKNRPLILFVQSYDKSSYQNLREKLSENQNQIDERHMVIIEIFENGLVRIDGNHDNQLNAISLRQYFSAQKGQLISILIGKDGRVKLRQTGRLDLNEIFSLIDRMPMRQQEMKKRY